MTSRGTTSGTGRSWAYLGALVGAGVSVAANVAHSYVPPAGAAASWSPHIGAVVGAVFWPVALLVAIEVLARVAWPAGGRWLIVRFGGLGPVATVAAVVSYRHLSGLLSFYGEDALTATVGPLAVDGLMVMATGALLATRPAGLDARQAPTGKRTTAATASGRAEDSGPDGTSRRADRRGRTATVHGADAAAVRVDTAARVAALRAAHPDMATTDIADRLGVSDRTVRRHLARHLATDTDIEREEVSA
jgi:DNA-binding transcriptional ArsR family regulator